MGVRGVPTLSITEAHSVGMISARLVYLGAATAAPVTLAFDGAADAVDVASGRSL